MLIIKKTGLEDPVFSEKKGYFEVLLPMSEPNLNKRQQKLINLLKRKEGNIRSIISYLGFSERTIRSDLATLEKKGFVKKRSVGKKYFYFV